VTVLLPQWQEFLLAGAKAMTAKPLSILPDPVLRQVAEPVAEVTDVVRQLMDDMVDTMREEHGLGLAAPQIGLSTRVIVMDCSDEDDADPVIWKMANPEIIEASDDLVSMEEGCLSIPGYRGEVTRPASVTVRYLDVDGIQQDMQATGLLAACVQHEIDHLNGRLFIDYLSRVKRDMIIRKMTKEARFERED
jgi:peptide deformylase